MEASSQMTIAHYRLLKRFHKRMVRSSPQRDWNVLAMAFAVLALCLLLTL